MKIINPATAETIKVLVEEVDFKKAYQSLKQGQKVWQKVPLRERLKVLKNFSDLLTENQNELAKLLTSEMGKPLWQSINEITGAKTRVDFFYKSSGKNLMPKTVYEDKQLTEKIVYEPLGIIGNISAWNYPYLVGVNVFVPALLAGNAVFYKPSEYTSLTGIRIQELWLKAGLPENVFKTVVGNKKIGEELLSLPLDGYFFTGSYKTGQLIYKKVAPRMVTCQMELGGKDPLYVAANNKHIFKVAEAVAEGAFYNAGQSCCAVERVYVHESVYNEFMQAFVAEVRNYKVGDPLEKGTWIGPLARKEQVAVLQTQVDDALAKGATLLLGGKAVEEKSNYFSPTILTNVNHNMLVMKEESFGPIIGVQKVKSNEEALSLMQDTEYGLTASVYSENKEEALDILEQLDTGTGYWNCCDRVSAKLPWSGRKNSGFGSTLSLQGIESFVKAKAYHLKSK